MAKTASEIPGKLFFKIGEVCELTDTQPYVLRFWESEFPQLSPRKNRSGQRVYQRRDIETIMRIKGLLYEEEYTIAGARRKLDEESSSAKTGGKVATARAAAPSPEKSREAPRAKQTARPAASEAEHPVDALEERVAHARSRTAIEDMARVKALESTLSEVKASLGEILALLKDR